MRSIRFAGERPTAAKFTLSEGREAPQQCHAERREAAAVSREGDGVVTGIHAIFYTSTPRRCTTFLKDVLDLHYVDAGNGRLFFAPPPTELAVHETEDDSEHELWLICDDVAATIQQPVNKGIKTTSVADRGWGLVTTLELPAGTSCPVRTKASLAALDSLL